MVDLRIDVGIEPVLVGGNAFQVVFGCSRTRLIRTIDLMLLKPYFHGTTRRNGAPFWLGNSRPYMPTARIARGCIASSMRKPSI